MSVVTVSAPRCYVDGDSPAVAATIEIEGKRYEIYYRASQGPLTTSADPFLAAALLPAMSIGAPLRVEGGVSPSLLPHVDHIQDIISVWYKTFRKVPVEVAGACTETPPAGRGVGCFFSGGIDSFYTLFKQRDEISHLIFVHGWDIALGDVATRATVSGRLREAAAELGKPLLEIDTNARSLFDVYTDWNKDSHGAAIGSAALSLQLQFSKVFIASTWAYDHMIPHGSHPLLDPLWGTDQLELVHDGCECHRWQKLERIMDEDIVRRYLRSCWHQKPGEYNCCSCHSCLMNMAFLRLHGVLDQFPVYDQPLDVEKLSHIPIRSVAPQRNHQLVLELAEAMGTDPEITQALRTALSHTFKIPPGPDALNEMQLHMNNLLEQLQQAKARVYLLEQRKYLREEDVQHQDREAKRLDEQLQAERERNAGLGEQLQAERARNAQLEAQFYRVTNSTSWRLTAPLRAASEAWRALRRGNKA